jgi:uncharacterized protein
MDMTGSHIIPASADRVFNALNDPEILRQCIPGCKSLEHLSETEMAATVVIKVGAMPAKFNCTVQISDLVYPKSYRITGEGKAGAAGSVKGGAIAELSEVAGGTKLRYEVTTQLEGPLSKFGTGLLDGIAKDLSGQFFENFSNCLSHEQEVNATTAPDCTQNSATIKIPRWIWLTLGAIAALFLFKILSS